MIFSLKSWPALAALSAFFVGQTIQSYPQPLMKRMSKDEMNDFIQSHMCEYSCWMDAAGAHPSNLMEELRMCYGRATEAGFAKDAEARLAVDKTCHERVAQEVSPETAKNIKECVAKCSDQPQSEAPQPAASIDSTTPENTEESTPPETEESQKPKEVAGVLTVTVSPSKKIDNEKQKGSASKEPEESKEPCGCDE